MEGGKVYLACRRRRGGLRDSTLEFPNHRRRQASGHAVRRVVARESGPVAGTGAAAARRRHGAASAHRCPTTEQPVRAAVASGYAGRVARRRRRVLLRGCRPAADADVLPAGVFWACKEEARSCGRPHGSCLVRPVGWQVVPRHATPFLAVFLSGVRDCRRPPMLNEHDTGNLASTIHGSLLRVHHAHRRTSTRY
ncbi:hypothetical protein PVAP13_2KG411405 [Panicum virgatum]|uniref:Uncharacterized protein n=1 Tax=Panicum virgatum TaxID=38727 RepID=A0A8T0WA07_PANVG|nr:hypothetical protein PVAP13_2KG411405 [Panicum virgatum]